MEERYFRDIHGKSHARTMWAGVILDLAVKKKSTLTFAVPSAAAENRMSLSKARASSCSWCPINTTEDVGIGTGLPLSSFGSIFSLSWLRGRPLDCKSLTRPLTATTESWGFCCPLFPFPEGRCLLGAKNLRGDRLSPVLTALPISGPFRSWSTLDWPSTGAGAREVVAAPLFALSSNRCRNVGCTT